MVLSILSKQEIMDVNKSEIDCEKYINSYIQPKYQKPDVLRNRIKYHLENSDIDIDELVAWTNFLNNEEVISKCYFPNDMSYWNCAADIDLNGRITIRKSRTNFKDLSTAEIISKWETEAKVIIFRDIKSDRREYDYPAFYCDDDYL